MKKIIIITAFLSACASAPMPPQKRTETVGQTIARDPQNFQTGVYANNKSGKSLYILVENLKDTEVANERKLSKLERELDYWRRENETVTSRNNAMRVNINQKVENEVVQDAKTLPPTPAETTVDQEHLQYPERYLNHGGIKGYKLGGSEPKAEIEYNDPYRLTNSGSVKPGEGTKPLYPITRSAESVEVPKVEPTPMEESSVSKVPKVADQPVFKKVDTTSKVSKQETTAVPQNSETIAETPPVDSPTAQVTSVPKSPTPESVPTAKSGETIVKASKPEAQSIPPKVEPLTKAASKTERAPASNMIDLPKPQVTEEGGL